MAKENKKAIVTQAEAEQAIKEINKIDLALAKLYTYEASDIAAVRQKYYSGENAIKRTALGFKKSVLEKSLKAYAKKDRKNWNAQSISTAFGNIGFRVGQPCVVLIKNICKTFGESLEKINNQIPDYIRIKAEIDKEKLIADYEGLDLASVGLKVEKKESFFVKTSASEQLEKATKKLKTA